MAAEQGTHISKPRSCDIDDWTEEHLEAMRVVGNTNADAYWCYNVPFVRRLPSALPRRASGKKAR